MQSSEHPSVASSGAEQVNKTIPLIVYVLYLTSLLVGLTQLVGVVMAYIYRAEAPAWQQTHYHFQIRTFWIGLLFLVVGLVLSAIFIGFLILLFWVIWLVVRCVKGISLLQKNEPIQNPTSWGFGG